MSMSTLASRLQYAGGDQIGRINKTKLWSFHSALKNSYQSRVVKTPKKSAFPCLINKGSYTSDFTKDYISIDFDAGLTAGDVVECLDDGLHWMIYLPFSTETAYLRSEIIRCDYTLMVDDVCYWIYFQGATETDIRFAQKQDINMNELNYSGTIYIKKDARTEKFFERFKVINVNGHNWQVQVADKETVPGIIELEIQEYFDDPVSELPRVVKEGCHEILGKEEVERDNEYGFMVRDSYYNPDYSWSIEDNPRVEIVSQSDDNRMCNVKVHDGAIGHFKVVYGDKNSGYHLLVKIAKACKAIKGPRTVYPYDIVEYSASAKGVYHLECTDKVAKIIDSTDTDCKIEITTSKKNDFVLYFKAENGTELTVPVQIDSL